MAAKPKYGYNRSGRRMSSSQFRKATKGHVMTARRRAALRKAQLASAVKRRKNAPKRYSKRRGAYARKLDKMAKSKKRSVRAAAWLSRGNGGWNSSVAYQVSKRRGKKAGQIKRKKIK